MCLTVCPLSNVKLCVVGDIAAHPLRTMLDAGLRATVNSDDPAYFGGYVNANYRAVADALDLSRADLVTLARNSFAGSFLDAKDKARHLAAITDYACRCALKLPAHRKGADRTDQPVAAQIGRAHV